MFIMHFNHIYLLLPTSLIFPVPLISFFSSLVTYDIFLLSFIWCSNELISSYSWEQNWSVAHWRMDSQWLYHYTTVKVSLLLPATFTTFALSLIVQIVMEAWHLLILSFFNDKTVKPSLWRPCTGNNKCHDCKGETGSSILCTKQCFQLWGSAFSAYWNISNWKKVVWGILVNLKENSYFHYEFYYYYY